MDDESHTLRIRVVLVQDPRTHNTRKPARARTVLPCQHGDQYAKRATARNLYFYNQQFGDLFSFA